ncbi:MAG TPA: hypothetical protein VF604_16250 [Pyrinomonadaceae bacterium]|jgi:hypothetical protein
MIIAETSFNEATKEFKKFLAENNLPSEILWVFLEDTFSRKTKFYEKHFWLKLPLAEENEKLAEKLYRAGQQRKFGICLSAFALCEGKVCCAVVIPKDKEDSEYLFMSPEHLKLSCVNDMPAAQAVRSAFRWKLFRLFPFKYKQGNFLVYLQSKKDLQFSAV